MRRRSRLRFPDLKLGPGPRPRTEPAWHKRRPPSPPRRLRQLHPSARLPISAEWPASTRPGNLQLFVFKITMLQKVNIFFFCVEEHDLSTSPDFQAREHTELTSQSSQHRIPSENLRISGSRLGTPGLTPGTASAHVCDPLVLVPQQHPSYSPV